MPGLIEWVGREPGAERLLFESDTLLYRVALQGPRIDAADITDAARLLILRDSALKLFNLSQLPSSGRFTP